MHTVDKCLGLLLILGLAYALGHSAVGKQHELLDKLVGVFRHLEEHIDRVTVFVNVKSHLLAVKFHRTVFVTAAAQNLGEFVKLEYLLGIVACARFDYLLSLLIGESAV